ncbi:MAG: ATP-binding cassette domain-containing protein [Thermoplasmatota archaeon]
MKDPVISARGLGKRYGDLEAVKPIDLDIERGEIFGLLGPNGAGKTTTINMLVTILAPTSGTALVNGYDVVREPGLVRKSVGIVFQEPSIDTSLTARENLTLHGRLYAVPRAELKPRIEEMLKLVGLTERADDIVKKFSGGMKRRLEIARGLLHKPAIVFLDEPTLGLDPATREHIWDYIRMLRDDFGTTILLTTHYMEEANILADRIAIIDHGTIVALDTPERLKASLGGDVVRIKTKTQAKVFEALPFVEKAEMKDGEVILTVREASVNLARIVQAAGVVEAVEVRRPTLEDVFLHFTGRDMREEEGGEMDAWVSASVTGSTNR